MGERLTAAAAARVAGLWAEARASGQRRAVRVYGAVDETRAAAAAVLAIGGVEALWVGDAPAGVERLAVKRARAALGREVAAAVVDLHAGVAGEAVGAVSGAVGAGGLLVLRMPVGFGEGGRFERLFAGAWAGGVAIGPGGGLGADGMASDGMAANGMLADDMLADGMASDGIPSDDIPSDGIPADGISMPVDVASDVASDDTEADGMHLVACRTPDQARAVAAVIEAAMGRRRRPVVLTADRGRGKSAALGIAVGRLLREASPESGRPGGVMPVVVVAPRRSAVEAVFEFAARAAGVAAVGGGEVLAAAGGSVRFVGPAELAEGGEGDAEETLAGAALVVVDEAAGLPVGLLTRIVRAHPRVVFSTTVHGYEGTGRGFAVRFAGVLDHEAPRWRAVRLEAPIRWRAGDPVEAAVDRALMLAAEPAVDERVAGAAGASVRVERWDRDAARGLGELWGLLVAAHYRTSPADLARLLDGPRCAVWVAWHGAGAVAGVALVEFEGGVDPALAAEIHAGRRRPAGHVLPEALAAHLDVAAAPGLRAARVVRIAVHPAARGRGVGRALLAAVKREAGVDYVGTTFGCTRALWGFWRRAGYVGVRVGVRRGRSSGLRSALMLDAVTPAGAEVVAAARARFAAWFPVALGGPLAGLEPGLAVALLDGAVEVEVEPAARRELALFAAGGREFEAVVDRLWRAAPGWVAAGVEGAEVLVERVLQRRGWGAGGRAAGQARLRAVVAGALAGRD